MKKITASTIIILAMVTFLSSVSAADERRAMSSGCYSAFLMIIQMSIIWGNRTATKVTTLRVAPICWNRIQEPDRSPTIHSQ